MIRRSVEQNVMTQDGYESFLRFREWCAVKKLKDMDAQGMTVGASGWSEEAIRIAGELEEIHAEMQVFSIQPMVRRWTDELVAA